MESRRGGRPPHVRPRSPSTGRPAPVRARPIAPSPTRLSRHRTIERRRGLPLVAKGLLALAVVALAASIVWIGSGGVGPFVASLATAFSGAFDKATATSSPSPGPTDAISDAPSIVPPVEPYTSLASVDVTVNVPVVIVGQEHYTVRLWVTLKDKEPALAAQATVGQTSVVVLPGVELAPGRNDIHATILGPGGESEPSVIVTWVLDTSKPKVTITSPKDGAAINRDRVTIKGKTQGRSTIVGRNEANGATQTVDAASDGLFQLVLPIEKGVNGITITATDPAGNAQSTILGVRRGSGKLTASLVGSAYRFRISRLPDDVTFTVTVTDPDGRPLAGATALFSITVPGLEAIVSSEVNTGGDGTARFRTRIPKGALAGSGLASVLVTTGEFGTTTDRQVLTVLE
jgi:Glucodextranase, domain B